MDRTLIETYNFVADSVPVTVNIWRLFGELVPLYEIILPEPDKGTLAIMEQVKDELSRNLSISVEEITDPHRALELRKRVLESAIILISKKFPAMSELQRNIIAGMLLHRMYGIGELEAILEDGMLEEIVINGSHVPISVYHKKYGCVITNKTIPKED